MVSKKSYIEHRFFCLNCGLESMPLQRKKNKLKTSGHRKKLYCYHCKKEVNHLECRDLEEVDEFKKAFKKGAFVEEAKTSIQHIKKEGKINGIYW